MGTQLRAGVVSLATCSAAPLKQNSLAILLSEEASAASWRLRVRTRTGTSTAELVTLLTTPVTGDLPPSRVIAIVGMPGVEEWAVEAELAVGPVDARAMLDLSSDDCCGSWGIFPIFAEVEVPTGGGFLTRRVQLAQQVLPAFPAFTAQAYTPLFLRTRSITYYVTYTRGAANGFPIMRAEWTNGVETDARESTLTTSFVLAPSTTLGPNARPNLYMQDVVGPAPDLATPLTWVMNYTVPDGAVGARLLMAELGLPGTPGTGAIAIAGSEGSASA